MSKILIDGEYYSKNIQLKNKNYIGAIIAIKIFIINFLFFNDLIFLGNYTRL
jgi:hypothetical protein